MFDDHLRRWLQGRLSLADQLNLQRRDAEADTYALSPTPRPGRCMCCGVRLAQADMHDPLLRCSTCRQRRRLEPRRRRVVEITIEVGTLSNKNHAKVRR